jgi:hypothetical protein
MIQRTLHAVDDAGARRKTKAVDGRIVERDDSDVTTLAEGCGHEDFSGAVGCQCVALARSTAYYTGEQSCYFDFTFNKALRC